MKTKFILHGGMTSYDNEHNDSYFREVAKELEDGDKVLFIGFARREPAERLKIYERDKAALLAQTDKKLVVVNAELDTLIEQVKSAKAVLITGGNTKGMVDDLRGNQEFIEALRGKVVAGSSAGAYLFSKYYFACQDNEIREGLGTLPMRIMAHYGNPEFNATDESLKEFDAYPNDLELVVIPECEWVIREVEL